MEIPYLCSTDRKLASCYHDGNDRLTQSCFTEKFMQQESVQLNLFGLRQTSAAERPVLVRQQLSLHLIRNVCAPDPQDSLGLAIEECARIVPDGLLVFFPSYKLMEKLSARWKSTGQWKRITKQKPLYSGEERSAGS